MAVGAAVANLGYTPVNKTGDLMSGSLEFPNQAGVLVREPGGAARNGVSMASGNQVVIGDRLNPMIVRAYDVPTLQDNALNQYAFWTQKNDGPGSGLDADTLDGVQGAGYATAANGVPSGLIGAFANAGSIPAGWTRFTAADGRFLVGAGTTFGQTFTEGAGAGSSWAHSHSTGSYSVAVQNAGVGSVSSGSGSSAIAGHAHTFSGTGAETTWIPPCHTVVWARKT
jgi:hypothetical protein